MLPSVVIDVREYLAVDGSSPYRKWFDSLNAQAAAKVAIALTRIEQGNLSNAKALEPGCTSTVSISDPVIEFTSAGTVTVL